MKIAILSDIHANLPAFLAVLREAESCGISDFVFLGDIVGYGEHPAECVDLVRQLGGRCVMGNHEAATLPVITCGRRILGGSWQESDFLSGLVHAADSLNDDNSSWLKKLPFTLEIPGAVVSHANLHCPDDFDYITDPASAAPTLELLKTWTTKTGFFGHTHVQEVFPSAGLHWLDDSRLRILPNDPCVVMVGSVGAPRSPNDQRAAWVIWDPAESIVELRRTEV